jgi:hypothetical protein
MNRNRTADDGQSSDRKRGFHFSSSCANARHARIFISGPAWVPKIWNYHTGILAAGFVLRRHGRYDRRGLARPAAARNFVGDSVPCDDGVDIRAAIVDGYVSAPQVDTPSEASGSMIDANVAQCGECATVRHVWNGTVVPRVVFRMTYRKKLLLTVSLVWWLTAPAMAQVEEFEPPIAPTLHITKVNRAPKLVDFLDMKPSPEIDGRMVRVTGFTQRLPRDGEPVSQPTEAYLGYDDRNFYAVFINFDAEPHLIRARMTPRERFQGDDKVDLFLDTFKDKRRAYVFTSNPLGVQMDGRWMESRTQGNFDSSFNALWHSEARITEQGYVVLMAIPFKSLRFPTLPVQEWGIVMIRWIPRNNESSTWPWVSARIEGRVNQGATLLLFTYLMNPWTALYVGYNSNMRNIDLIPTPLGNRVTRSGDFMQDSRQFFVKFSHLFQF